MLRSARPSARASETSHATSRRACFVSSELELLHRRLLDAPSPIAAAAAASSIRARSSQADAYDTTETTYTYPPSHSNSNPYRLPIAPPDESRPPVFEPDFATAWIPPCNRFTSGRTSVLVVLFWQALKPATRRPRDFERPQSSDIDCTSRRPGGLRPRRTATALVVSVWPPSTAKPTAKRPKSWHTRSAC